MVFTPYSRLRTPHCQRRRPASSRSTRASSSKDSYLRQSLTILRGAVAPDHPELAHALDNFGQFLCNQQHKYAEAEQVMREALAIRRKTLPAGHPRIADSLLGFAGVLRAQDRLADLEPLCREALDIRRHTLPPGHPAISASINSLAVLLGDLKKYDKAEPLFRELIAIRRAAIPADDAAVASALHNLGNMFLSEDKFADAEPLFREALEIRRKALPADDIQIASTLNELGYILGRTGKLDQAEPILLEVLAMEQKGLAQNDPDRLTTTQSLAVLYSTQGKHDVAAPYWDELLAVARTELPPESLELATRLTSAAGTMLAYKQYDRAVPLYAEALKIREAKQPDDWKTFRTRGLLGRTLLDANRLTEAEPLLRDAYERMNKKNPPTPVARRYKPPRCFDSHVNKEIGNHSLIFVCDRVGMQTRHAIDDQCRKILFICSNHVGNNIFCTPAIHFIKRHFPDVSIDVLATSRRGAAAFECNRDVSKVHLLYLMQRMRRIAGRYEFVVGMYRDFATDVLRGVAVPHVIINPDLTQHRADQRLSLMQSLTGRAVVANDRKYVLSWNDTQAKFIERSLASTEDDGFRVGLHLGCGRTAVHGWKFWYPGRDRDARLWPLENYIELAQQLRRAEPRIRIVITGSPNERFLSRKFVAAVPETINLVGTTSIPSVAALMTQLQLFITQDTGILHVACSADVPVIGLFGPSKVECTGPYPMAARHTILQRPKISDITPSEVAAEALRVLHRRHAMRSLPAVA